MSSFLLYAAVLSFAAGIFSRSFVTFGLPEIVFLLMLGFVCALLYRRGLSHTSGTYLLCACVCFSFFAAGALRMELASWYEHDPYLETQLDVPITIEGTVQREVDIRENSAHVYVETDTELFLVKTNRTVQVAYGDFVHVEGVLQKPESFQTDLGRTFNYPRYLHARGVTYVIAFADVSTRSTSNGNPVLESLFTFKHAFMDNVAHVLAQPEAGLASGLLLGVKEALGDELETVFRKAGIMHIVVLSGYNIMLVIMFVMYVLALVLPFRGRLWFGLCAIFLFACMVGLSSTVIRASVMAGLLVVAQLTGRTYVVVRALIITAAVMLLWNPYLLAFDVGFQLSFMATLGLILVSPHIERHLTFMPQTIGLREFLTATLATQLFVMPILLYQIGEFSIVSVVVNVLVLPMVPVAMLLTFITGMVGFVSLTLATPFAFLAYLSLSYILVVAHWFASLPFAAVTVPAFPFFIVVLAYGVLFYGIFRITKATNDREHRDSMPSWTIVEESSVAHTYTKT